MLIKLKTIQRMENVSEFGASLAALKHFFEICKWISESPSDNCQYKDKKNVKERSLWLFFYLCCQLLQDCIL